MTKIYATRDYLKILTIPQIFTRVRDPLAASAHEVGTTQIRVLIGCVFVEIIIESKPVISVGRFS
jgi:hypothetical protein